MPKLSLDIPHALSQEEAARRLKEKFAAAQCRVSRPRERLPRGSGKTIPSRSGFRRWAWPSRARSPSSTQWIRLAANLPLAATFLKGAIESRIRQEVDGLLAPRTATDDTDQHGNHRS